MVQERFKIIRNIANDLELEMPLKDPVYRLKRNFFYQLQGFQKYLVTLTNTYFEDLHFTRLRYECLLRFGFSLKKVENILNRVSDRKTVLYIYIYIYI